MVWRPWVRYARRWLLTLLVVAGACYVSEPVVAVGAYLSLAFGDKSLSSSRPGWHGYWAGALDVAALVAGVWVGGVV